MRLAAIVLIALVTLPAGDPPKKDPPKKETCAPFDKPATRAALESVQYKDCLGSGEGFVTIKFSPAGHVINVTAIDGVAGNSCIEDRFSSVHVPPFCPPTKTVAWHVSLP